MNLEPIERLHPGLFGSRRNIDQSPHLEPTPVIVLVPQVPQDQLFAFEQLVLKIALFLGRHPLLLFMQDVLLDPSLLFVWSVDVVGESGIVVHLVAKFAGSRVAIFVVRPVEECADVFEIFADTVADFMVFEREGTHVYKKVLLLIGLSVKRFKENYRDKIFKKIRTNSGFEPLKDIL
ncbi:MAG: hypothetical protein L6R42_001592 [Xanthoria sp. 1 TBL-2021]|nr:MAG: hypothetical protein L6R42_001592 [Xanthoria sp. 1 TBL-2021]